jgi:hypothetical protein
MAERESPTEIAAFWSNLLTLVVAIPVSSLVAIGVITVDILQPGFQLDPWDITFLCFVGMSAIRLYLGGCLFDYNVGIRGNEGQHRSLYVEFVIQLCIFFLANLSVIMVGSYGYFMASVAVFLGSLVTLAFWPYFVYVLMFTLSVGQLRLPLKLPFTNREIALRRAFTLLTDVLVAFIAYHVMMRLSDVGRLPEDTTTAVMLSFGFVISLVVSTKFHAPDLYQLWLKHINTTLAASSNTSDSSRPDGSSQ